MSIELAVDRLIDGQRVGYWAPTYKDGYEWWNEIKQFVFELIESKDEQVRQIRTITGGILDVWSMDDPDSGRGRKYHRAIMDECEKAPKFKQAWTQTIRATLSDFQGDAWFLSTPKFGRTYFKELAEMPKKDGSWISWKFTTYDNPHIKPEEVDDARRQLDELTFKCEFLAEDVDLVASPFCYAFSEHRHVRHVTANPYDFMRLSFDFNVDPIVCLASQYDEGVIKILSEFRLANSNIYELCDRIKARYPQYVYMVTGDATGQSRSAMTRGNINYYSVIQSELNLNDGQLQLSGVNPSVKNTRVLTNSILQNGNLAIDPSCTYLIEDMKYVEVTPEGDIDKTKDKHRSHLLDALRYTLNTWHRNFLDIPILYEAA